MGRAREGGVLVPVALVLLLALAFFILQTYAGTLDRLAEEHRERAVALARELAASLGPDAGEAELERALRPAEPGVRSGAEPVGIALVDAGGIRVAAGDVGAGTPGAGPVDSVRVWGPRGTAPGRVVAEAPLRRGEAAVRVELAAPALAADLARLRVVRWVVLGVGAGVLVLVLLFLRSLFAPYEALLAQARIVGGPAGFEEGEDEVAFLLSTFEQALHLLQGAGGRAGAESAAAGLRAAGESGEDLTSLGRTLGASLTSGVLLLDRGGRVLAVNPLGASLLDLDPPPRPGTPLTEALAGQGRLASLLGAAVERGEALKRVEHAAGSRTLGLTLHPLQRDPDRDGDAAARTGAGGEPRGFLLLFTDLTETQRREREKRLADGLAELGAMAAGAAHELRNSLATLKGYLGLAERRVARRGAEGGGADPASAGVRGGVRDEELDEYLAEIRAESDRLERVLADFLAFARPGTARVAEVRLDGLLRRAVADPALAAAAPFLRLAVEEPPPGEAPDSWRLRADPLLLERAVKNLLSNAAEAVRGGEGDEGPAAPGGAPEVTVALVHLGTDYEVRVSDSGPGLPPAVRERLFTPFVTGRPGGVGLGLALTHRIATLHGGSLTLEDRPGGGTVARLRLPASAPAEGNGADPGA